MAKKEEKKRYRKGGPARLDMRKGGRVALQRGGPRRRGREEEALEQRARTRQRPQPQVSTPNRTVPAGPFIAHGAPDKPRETIEQPAPIAPPVVTQQPTPVVTQQPTPVVAQPPVTTPPVQPSPVVAQRDIIGRPETEYEESYTNGGGGVSGGGDTEEGDEGGDDTGDDNTGKNGENGDDVRIPGIFPPLPPPPPPSVELPKKVPVGEELTTTEIAAPTRPDATTIKAEDIADEQVSTVEDIRQAQAPREVTGQEYTAEELSRVPVFDPATGAVTENMKASLDEKALTFQASGVDFTQEQKDRPLLDIVTGVLSPEAKANAAKVAGTDLPRLLRAKKQLRRAGLSEEEINLIGSDPDSLEAELGDYTEEQRGMIAGLPDEALVSTQMNSLLEGMESGEIPAFARPAVAAVNQMLAERGLSASTVGRDNLFNAVIQAAMPLAQSNAQSIKESIFQQRGIEAQAELQNAQMRQQTALSNSEKVFNMDMAQFSADQQRAMSQSKFLQTTSLQEVTNNQQAVVQKAANLAQLDIANLNTQERLQVQNAQAFLNMEMTNLDRTQQQRALNSQQEQQQMLSNQASVNAARNFAATSQQQADQFTAGLAANIDQFNAQQFNAMGQFNATQENAAEARRAGREADVAKFNAELITRNDQFNAQQDFETNKWLANNTALVKQANMDWRRKINLADTAALNAVNMQNSMNAYNASEKDMDRLWQTARDEADFAFRSAQNEKQRETTIIATAIANEGDAGNTYDDAVLSLIKSAVAGWGG